MDTSFSNSVGNHGSLLSDKSLESMKDGIRDVQKGANDAGVRIVDRVGSVVSQMTNTTKQGLDTVGNAVQQARDSVSESSEALITYTKENPVKALLIAAASGALLWTLLKAVAPAKN